MKKLLMLIAVMTFLFGLSACDEGEGDGKGYDSDTIAAIIDTLEDAGYVLTEHDQTSREYFRDNTLSDMGLDVEVAALYIGYLDGGSWVQVIGLENIVDAGEVRDAFIAENTQGQFVFNDGNTVLLTFTQATYDLFQNN